MQNIRVTPKIGKRMEQEGAFRLSFLLQQYRKINAECRETYRRSRNAAFPPRAGVGSKTRDLFLKAAPQNARLAERSLSSNSNDISACYRSYSVQCDGLQHCKALTLARGLEAGVELTPVLYDNMDNSLASLASSQSKFSVFEDFTFDMEDIELESLPSVSWLSYTSDNYTVYEKYAYYGAKSYLSRLACSESALSTAQSASDAAESECALESYASSCIGERPEPPANKVKQYEREITEKLDAIRRVDPYFLRKKSRYTNAAALKPSHYELDSENYCSFVSLDISLAESVNAYTVYKSALVYNELGLGSAELLLTQNKGLNDAIRRFREENAAWLSESGEEQYLYIEEEA